MTEQLYQRKIVAVVDGTEIRAGWIYGGSDLAFDYYWIPAERCEHGNIDPHFIRKPYSRLLGEWCPGAGNGDTE